MTEIDLDDVFVEGGRGFGPPGFELEPPLVDGALPAGRYDLRSPLREPADLPLRRPSPASLHPQP